MIEAEFLGGPHDGDRIVLKDPHPVRVARQSTLLERTDQPARNNVSYTEITPRCRPDGMWVLPWKEAS